MGFFDREKPKVTTKGGPELPPAKTVPPAVQHAGGPVAEHPTAPAAKKMAEKAPEPLPELVLREIQKSDRPIDGRGVSAEKKELR